MADRDYIAFTQDRLADLRTKAGYSAREVSTQLGLNEAYLNRIENHHTVPSLREFFRLCDYLDVTPQEFFHIEAANPPKLNRLMDKLNKLDDRQLDRIEGVVDGYLED